ncbi:MAG: tRNA uridine-5-carboxymethylaminomethyl(34) synthesis GTPase MnmE [Candidatus Zixiibacteriota bacterium]
MPRHHKNSSGDDDTIVAVITPPGEGGIAALRLCGSRSLTLINRFFKSAYHKNKRFTPFLMRYGYFAIDDNSTLDEITAVFMPEGESYTGLDQVEIFCHGGRQVVKKILDELIAAGARPATPGEFTRMAFLNGRIDLTRAEAVADIIAANTDWSYRVSREHLLGAYSRHIENLRKKLVAALADIEASIDFPDEEIVTAESEELLETVDDIRHQIEELLATYTGGRIVREGFKIAIGGRPNAGKSSLFNQLLQKERALVHPTAGTTRDYLSEWIDLEGIAVNLIDTAGLREKGSQVEQDGHKQALKIMGDADLVIWMVDISLRGWKSKLEIDLKLLNKKVILLVGNKIDLVKGQYDTNGYVDMALISCLNGSGIESLKERISELINDNMPDLTSGTVVTSARHKHKLEQAIEFIKNAREKIAADDSPELTAFELNQAVKTLDEITGKVYNEQILDEIFARFCIGK